MGILDKNLSCGLLRYIKKLDYDNQLKIWNQKTLIKQKNILVVYYEITLVQTGH